MGTSAILVVTGILSSFCASAQVDDVKQVLTGRVESIDMKMADCRQSDEGPCFSTGDFDGAYHFRPQAGSAWVTMNAGDFTTFVSARLSDVTRREVPQLQDWVVRYTSADGRAWLWRAGQRLAKGQWKLVRLPLHAEGKAFESVQLCYSTTALAGFPMKKPGADGWDCAPASWIMAYPEIGLEKGYESRVGDVFHLAANTIPYELTPNVRPEWPAEAQK